MPPLIKSTEFRFTGLTINGGIAVGKVCQLNERRHRNLAVYQVAAAVVAPVPGLVVAANISVADEAADAVAQQAEGIGLYRTEYEFLSAARILNEDEQYARYVRVIRTMGGQRVCFRLLDNGGDKQAPPFEMPREDNPNLGYRGSRFLLGRPDLLRAQARALTRVSQHGPVDVLYPMIVDCDQFIKLTRLFRDATADLVAGDIRHGVMFEISSACFEARPLLELADFGSIGTNDLMQYLFAVDRNNEWVAYDYEPDRPAFWAVLGQIVTAAAETGRTVSVCGEVASNPDYLPKLMKLGLKTLSVSPRFVPQIRLAARECGER